MYTYMKLIVQKSLPLNYVECPIFRAFSGSNIKFGVKLFKETLFKVVELVEKKIEEGMKGSRGYILYDGWSDNSMHYAETFGVYCREIQVMEQGQVKQKFVLSSPLLSVSPMAKLDSGSNDELAESFNVDVHIEHFRDILPYYGVKLSSWILCSIGDNCNTNFRIASRLGVPHVGCMSHKMHSEMRNMINKNVLLSSLVEDISETMRQCRVRLKNRAILHNLSELAPVLPNDTR